MEHGIFKVTITGHKKEIGSLVQIYNYTDIERITIKQHIKYGGFAKSVSGYKTYVLKVYMTNSAVETFVLASELQTKPYMNLVNLLKKALRMTGVKIESKSGGICKC